MVPQGPWAWPRTMCGFPQGETSGWFIWEGVDRVGTRPPVLHGSVGTVLTALVRVHPCCVVQVGGGDRVGTRPPVCGSVNACANLGGDDCVGARPPAGSRLITVYGP